MKTKTYISRTINNRTIAHVFGYLLDESPIERTFTNGVTTSTHFTEEAFLLLDALKSSLNKEALEAIQEAVDNYGYYTNDLLDGEFSVRSEHTDGEEQ